MRDGNNKTSLLANDPDVSLPYLIKSQVYTIPSLNAQRELRESLSRLKPDLVHASLTLSPLDFRLPELCHQLNLPLIATFHTAFDSKLRNITANTQQLTYQLYAPSLAKYDKVIKIDADEIVPQVTWGTSPEDVVSINGNVPDPAKISDSEKQKSMFRALEYMGLEPNTNMTDIKIDKVFIGSCTNGRIEDLRAVSKIADGRKVAEHVNAIIVPGSGLVKKQAEKEGLDKIFIQSGFEWRDPGCSMCLAMNADKLKPKERCASTSNRNFEGRQGRGGRTHLMSPAMAAAAAIKGKLSDCREF